MLTYTVRVKIEKDGGWCTRIFPLADVRFRSKGAPAEEESAQDEADELPPEEGAEGQRNAPRRQGERRKNEKPRTVKPRRQERPAQRAEELPPREGGQPQAEGQERRRAANTNAGTAKKAGTAEMLLRRSRAERSDFKIFPENFDAAPLLFSKCMV